MAALDDLIAARDSLTAKIATEEAKAHVPDYSLDGQSFQANSSLQSLYDRLEKLNELIAAHDPYELRSEMM